MSSVTSSIKQIIRKVKDQQYSPIEVKVREATNSEPWGASTTLLAEIARATYDYHDYPKLLAMVWKRVTDVQHVMHVQKALILIEYLLRNGSQRFVEDCKARSRDIAKLTRYKHYDSNNQDDAKDARAKAKVVYELLTDENRLAEERAKAERIKDVKSSAFGSDSYFSYSGASSSAKATTGGLSREAYERARQIETAFDRSLRGEESEPEDEPAPSADAHADAKAATHKEEIRRPSLSEPENTVQAAAASTATATAPAQAPAASNPTSLFDDPFDPFSEPSPTQAPVGPASAAYQARLGNGTSAPSAATSASFSQDSFEDYLLASAGSSAAASAPRQPVQLPGVSQAGDVFDLLTSSTPAPAPVDASGLADLFAQGLRLKSAAPPQQAPLQSQPQPQQSRAADFGWTDLLSSPSKPAGSDAKIQADVWNMVNLPAPAPAARSAPQANPFDPFGAPGAPLHQSPYGTGASAPVGPFAPVPATTSTADPFSTAPTPAQPATLAFDPFTSTSAPAARAPTAAQYGSAPQQTPAGTFNGLNW